MHLGQMNRCSTFLAPLGLSALAAFSAPALAEDPFDDPVRAEVLQGWDLPDGRRLAAVRLTLDPGWKTYWRAPGDAGIPPQFDWSRARNLSDVAISWPTPHVYEDNGMQSIGYKGTVVIPLYLTPANPVKPVRLRTTMSLGVCADVCMPHQIKFDTLLDRPDARPTPAIVAALADAPYASDEAGVRSATCSLRPTDDGIQIEARVTLPHTGGREVAVIETGTDGLWISEAQTSRAGDTVTAISEMIHVDGGAFAIDRSDVRITIFGGNYAVDIKGCTAG
jgi:DsbC/DsbD-like thiol-disulfide interchange protein